MNSLSNIFVRLVAQERSQRVQNCLKQCIGPLRCKGLDDEAETLDEALDAFEELCAGRNRALDQCMLWLCNHARYWNTFA